MSGYKNIKDSLTQNELKKMLTYDKLTGVFTWNKKCVESFSKKHNKSWNTRYANKRAGSVVKNGYIRITIKRCGKKYFYYAHRLAFLYVFGYFPEQVDHDNHIRTDNRWKNLKCANNRSNSRNHSLHKNNTSGVCGVTFDSVRGKWIAQLGIRIKGKVKQNNGGGFLNIDDAVKKRKQMEKEYNFNPNHGKKRIENSLTKK